ncbi:Cof-type HAD-IIB family hydrolase [Vallitalea sp.]|uniref:Cof-type HAD-IIB family hydrolase n=1 Tax=Vallitalea sp. TaxID=1882829 RepID=UPI00260084FB|nr:Cof-type HAD-IIB family hydrolase [Vallitalea sp.]MCT4687673.1 Cof-type HAD-IIB family hydrolase [Vallitalea sp.]
MRYKMLVLDMDDTLLDDDLSISTDNIKAIQEANRKGTIITICSGRVSKSIINVINELGITNDNDYYISYNGAVINDFSGNNIFYEPLVQDILPELIDIGREYGVDIQLYDKKGVIVEQVTSRIETYQKLSNISAYVVDDLKNYDKSIKVLYNYDDIKLLEKIQEHIIDLYNEKVNVFFSKPTYLEVLSKKANKGVALEYLANYLHIDREEIIAVGDSFNDKYMIKYAGMGVAICNARDEIKDMANYVTKCNNNQSGVAEVINKFILNDF